MRERKYRKKKRSDNNNHKFDVVCVVVEAFSPRAVSAIDVCFAAQKIKILRLSVGVLVVGVEMRGKVTTRGYTANRRTDKNKLISIVLIAGLCVERKAMISYVPSVRCFENAFDIEINQIFSFGFAFRLQR